MRKGQHCSEEIKAKQRGEKNHMWGKHQSPEANAKRSASLKLNNPCKGRPLSAEHRAKLSAARMGKPPWNKGKIGEMSEETRTKISQSLIGRTVPLEVRDKISKTLTGKYVREKNVNWRGGKDSVYCPKFNHGLRRRIRAFFEYRCVTCGKSTEENVPARQLSCHHVEYNKQACCDGEPIHFAALCHRCHTRTTNGDRAQWEAMIHRIIDEIWNGKSYFTKEEWKEYRGVNKMRTLMYILMVLSLIVPVIAYDQRDGSNAIGYLAPDPSLKTTDAFYGGQPAPALDPAYQLPPVFGGAAPVVMLAPPDWMDLSSHNAKMNATNESITAASSYDLTEEQMRDIPLGEENYL